MAGFGICFFDLLFQSDLGNLIFILSLWKEERERERETSTEGRLVDRAEGLLSAMKGRVVLLKYPNIMVLSILYGGDMWRWIAKKEDAGNFESLQKGT